MGFNLFVLQGLTGRDMTVIARYALPYFLLMVLAVVLLYNLPRPGDLAARAHDRLMGSRPRPVAFSRRARAPYRRTAGGELRGTRLGASQSYTVATRGSASAPAEWMTQ